MVSNLAVVRCDCSVERSVGRRCSSAVACKSRSFYKRDINNEHQPLRCSTICYMNSVNRVNQGCRPRALLIGPMRMARLMSDRFDNSISTPIECEKHVAKIALIYWYSNAQWYPLEWRPHRCRLAALVHRLVERLASTCRSIPSAIENEASAKEKSIELRRRRQTPSRSSSFHLGNTTCFVVRLNMIHDRVLTRFDVP